MIIRKITATVMAAGLLAAFATSCDKQDKETAPATEKSGQTTSKAPAPSADMEELKVELPKPEFQGTPKPVKLPAGLKLHKTTSKRGAIMVPKGTVELSKGKEVTGSDDMPVVGDLELITDGDKSAEDGCFVELAPGTQWVQIDLGEKCAIQAILIWHYHLEARVYHDVIVQVSDDPDFLNGVTTLFNNDHDNSSGLGVGKDEAYVETFEGWLVKGNGTKGRYVRLYSNGNTSNEMNHYIEVAVYGKPLK